MLIECILYCTLTNSYGDFSHNSLLVPVPLGPVPAPAMPAATPGATLVTSPRFDLAPVPVDCNFPETEEAGGGARRAGCGTAALSAVPC